MTEKCVVKSGKCSHFSPQLKKLFISHSSQWNFRYFFRFVIYKISHIEFPISQNLDSPNEFRTIHITNRERAEKKMVDSQPFFSTSFQFVQCVRMAHACHISRPISRKPWWMAINQCHTKKNQSCVRNTLIISAHFALLALPVPHIANAKPFSSLWLAEVKSFAWLPLCVWLRYEQMCIWHLPPHRIECRADR